MARSVSKKSKSESGSLAPPRSSASSGKKSYSGGGKKRFVLLIGDEGSILIFMHGAKVVRRLFAPSAQPSHSEAMVEIMQANPSVPIKLLVDVIDQQYVPHTFPPVSPLSVGGLVKRRLQRDFQPEDLKGSLRIGRDPAGRKEWKYLLVALAKTPLISEWLDLILALPNEMKGVYLVPIEAVNYVTMLSKKRSNDKPLPWQLLISHNKVSGFRQVVLQDGKLIFTRVSQAIDDTIPAVIAGNIEQEIINTIEYIKRLEFREGSELEATVVVSQDVIESLDLQRFNFGRAWKLSPLNVAETLGLEQAALSADRFGDVVLGAAFGISKKHALRFTNAYIEKLSMLYKARLGIRVGGVLIALGLMAIAGLSIIAAIENASGITLAEKKNIAMKPDLEKMKRAVDGLNKDIAYKSAVVATYGAYIAADPKIEDSLAPIVPLLNTQNRVVAMSWDIAGTEQKNGSSPSPSPSPSPSSAPANSEKLPLEVRLDIDFSTSGNTAESLDIAANRFLDVMREKLPRYNVTADAYPWRKEESQNERVSLDQAATKSAAVQNAVAVFRLRGLKKQAASAVGAAARAPVAVAPAVPAASPTSPVTPTLPGVSPVGAP